jgi:hypothetical protein
MADRRITTTIDGDLWHRLGILAAQLQTTKRALLEEALRDVLAKRGEKSMTKLNWQVIETTAMRIAEMLDFDGECWETDDGRDLDTLAKEAGAEVTYHDTRELTRYYFSDGSAIVAGVGGWDIEGDEPFSWAGAEPGTIIYATDESTVERVPGGYRWTWFEPEEGSEFVPEAGAAEHFEQSGRDDIAKCIREGIKYVYGHQE